MIYVTLLFAFIFCGIAECQPALGSETHDAAPADYTPIDLSNLLDAKCNLFVPHEVKISQEIFVKKSEAAKNLLVIWTDQNNLKALNLMKIYGQQYVKVIGFPVNKAVCKQEVPVTTYQNKGREGLVEIVEQTLGIRVDYYVQVDQAVFEKAGEMIGPVDLCGHIMPVAEAFEETPFTQNIGCENIIRSLVSKLTEPGTLTKLPHLAYIFATEVETNMGVMDILQLYTQVHKCGSDNIHRVIMPIPGGSDRLETARAGIM